MPNEMEEINRIFEQKEIPITILKDTTHPTNSLPSNCTPTRIVEGEDVFILQNKKNNETIGFIVLKKIRTCVYISYMCITLKYRGYGFGVFLGFIGVYYTIFNNKNAIFSYGVGNEVNSTYNRHMIDLYKNSPKTWPLGKKWVPSQALLITKLGFIDNYAVTTNVKNFKKNTDYCGKINNSTAHYSYAETILYMNGDLEKYEKYKKQVKDKPKDLFQIYIASTVTGGGNIKNKHKKDKRYGKYKHGDHTHKTKRALKKCKKLTC